MVFLALGISHKTAPIEVREKIAQANNEKSKSLLQQFIAEPFVSEAAVLSTCNRTELYCDTSDREAIVPWLAKHHQLQPKDLSHHFYHFENFDAIKHGMRVASGLDSMMLGEPQILGQMKNAFKLAENIGSIGPTLRPIFHHIFSASKRIRSNTAIGVNPVSVAYAAVNLIKTLFTSLNHLNVLLIGSGQTSQLLASYLKREGVNDFFVASRTADNANTLANNINGTSLSLAEIPTQMAHADIIVSATACPLPFITKSLVENALTKRGDKPMFFLDLSVPRDIEVEVQQLPNTYLYNIDDIQTLVNDGINERQDAAKHAEQIIDCELDDYIRWHRSLRAKGIICKYRSKAHEMGDKEIKRTLSRIKHGELEVEDAMKELTNRLINKLAHKPTVGLKRAASDSEQDILTLFSYLFDD
jgi:glutamyl-tRNA reductase